MRSAQKYVRHGIDVALIVTVLLLWASWGFADSEPDPGYMEGRVNHGKTAFGGLDRDYAFYIPKNFKQLKSKSPLVFALHGFNMPLEAMIKVNASMHPLADEDGAIIVYPKATGSVEKGDLHWNDLAYPFAASDKVDDVAYLSFLIDFFIRDYNGDPGQGVRYGPVEWGDHDLCTELPDSRQARGHRPHDFPGDRYRCREKYPDAKGLPIMMINGDKDPLLPPSGRTSMAQRKCCCRSRRTSITGSNAITYRGSQS